MIDTILFDLDGTLLPFNDQVFIDKYFKLIKNKFNSLGFDSEMLISAIWKAMAIMINNDGEISNEAIFWKSFKEIYPNNYELIENEFINFYQNEFQELSLLIEKSDYPKRIIDLVKGKGYSLVLATNPVFPRVATENRMKWGKLNKDDFQLITTFENSFYCKPNLSYYQDILKIINKTPDKCLMIGNDIDEDMIASKLGIDTFLVTDYLLNKNNQNINDFKNGRLADLYEYLKKLPNIR